MGIEVRSANFGVVINDEYGDGVAVETNEIYKLIQDLEKHLPTPETHSCSCHVRYAGSCDVCKAIGCKVFDFNQVALPQFDTGPDHASFFIEPPHPEVGHERQHGRETGHATIMVRNEPGWRCMDCSVRSPAWELTISRSKDEG